MFCLNEEKNEDSSPLQTGAPEKISEADSGSSGLGPEAVTAEPHKRTAKPVKPAGGHHAAHPYEHRHQSASSGGRNLGWITIALAGILGALLLINTVQTGTMGGSIAKAVAEAKERAVPAKIALTAVTDKKCPQCFDISEILTSLKSGKVNITKEENLDISSKEAQKILSSYAVSRVPAIIVTGELNKTSLGQFEENNGALIFSGVKAPYTDVPTKRIVGIVAATQLVDSSCQLCSDLDTTMAELKKIAAIGKERMVEFASAEGKALAGKYRIEKIPALLLSEDISLYPEVTQEWESIGTIEPDGMHVLRETGMPYTNATTGKITGLVSLVMINDSSCRACYDVALHKSILRRYGVAIKDEKSIDISSSEGKKLIEKYSISAAPTIVLSPEAKGYEQFVRVWPQVGTIEADGSFIFRKIEVLNQRFKFIGNNSMFEPVEAQPEG